MLSVYPTPLDGLVELESTAATDARGHFSRLYCADVLASLRPGLSVRQINLSTTIRRGTVRGLHWQGPPVADCKIVRCLRGRVFDVAVDLRPASGSFGAWHAVELDASSDRALCIPEGFAHGFQTLTDDVELLYVHTASYRPDCEHGIHYADRDLGIAWPLPVTTVSERDSALPRLADAHGELVT